jgi:hypothetical protein
VRPTPTQPNRDRPWPSRKLTDAESVAFRELVDQARLLDGDAIGVDGRSSDIPFTTLKVGVSPCVVLVTSGNESFAEGARKVLIEWFKREEDTLRRAYTKR